MFSKLMSLTFSSTPLITSYYAFYFLLYIFTPTLRIYNGIHPRKDAYKLFSVWMWNETRKKGHYNLKIVFYLV